MHLENETQRQTLQTQLPFPVLDSEAVAARLVDITREQFAQSGFQKAVLGLSGGIDSALALAICAQALGKENVLAVRLPYKTSSSASLEHAQMLIEQFCVPSLTVDISPVCDAFFARTSDITSKRKGNVMARVRMIVLYDLSAARNALVVGTGNKSEILLGYSTLWGDSACGYNPLASLYKTHVRALAAYFSIPREIITKAPSADLWEGQSDEQELTFSYDEADRLLYYSLEKKMQRQELQKKIAACSLSPELLDRVLQRVKDFAYKSQPPRTAELQLF